MIVSKLLFPRSSKIQISELPLAVTIHADKFSFMHPDSEISVSESSAATQITEMNGILLVLLPALKKYI